MARLSPTVTLGIALAAACALGRADAQATADAPATGAAAPATSPAAGVAADLTLPPQIDPSAAPGDARLEPAPEAEEDLLEAVISAGQTDFRLPDLGTSMRRDEDERDPGQRIDVTFIPLYDPENEDPTATLFENLEEGPRVETLKIFEIKFGEREE